MVIRSFVKTLEGSEPEALATDSIKGVLVSAKIYADNGDTVYIGGEDVSATNGFLLPTTPGDAISLGEVSDGKARMIDLTKTYVVGAQGDKVRVVYLKESTMI